MAAAACLKQRALNWRKRLAHISVCPSPSAAFLAEGGTIGTWDAQKALASHRQTDGVMPLPFCKTLNGWRRTGDAMAATRDLKTFCGGSALARDA